MTRFPPDDYDDEYEHPDYLTEDDPERLEEWEDMENEFPWLDGLDDLDNLDEYLTDEDNWYEQ